MYIGTYTLHREGKGRLGFTRMMNALWNLGINVSMLGIGTTSFYWSNTTLPCKEEEEEEVG